MSNVYQAFFSLWWNTHPTERRHVLDNGLTIEANVLCQTIDLLCGSIILVLKGSNLHNINLPRSWLNILLRKNRPDSDGTMPLNISEIVVKIFVVTLGKLAYNLHLGQQGIGETLLQISGYHSRNLTDLLQDICSSKILISLRFQFFAVCTLLACNLSILFIAFNGAKAIFFLDADPFVCLGTT